MSTRSTIWIKNEDGSFDGIYCHWDGYLSNNGKLLIENYIDKEKVKKLIALGSISSLDKECDCPEKHTFDHPVKGYVIAYHRDRGEDYNQYHTESLEGTSSYLEEYNYYFIDGKWMYRCNASDELKEVTEKVIKND